MFRYSLLGIKINLFVAGVWTYYHCQSCVGDFSTFYWAVKRIHLHIMRNDKLRPAPQKIFKIKIKTYIDTNTRPSNKCPLDVEHPCAAWRSNTNTVQAGKNQKTNVELKLITYNKKRQGSLEIPLKVAVRHSLTVNGRCLTFELWYNARETAVNTLFGWLQNL